MNKITIFYLISTIQFIHYLLEKVACSLKIENASHYKIRTMLSPVLSSERGKGKGRSLCETSVFWHHGLALAAVRYLRSCRERKRV